MVVLDSTIVNIALPSAQRALGFPNTDRQWVVTAYALAFGSLLLPGGRIGDMFTQMGPHHGPGRRLAVSSALGGAAGSFAMLVTPPGHCRARSAPSSPRPLGTLVSTFTHQRELTGRL